MSYSDSSEQIASAVKWTRTAAKAIQDAGGNVDAVLAKFPDELLNTLIRNSIHLTYKRD